MSRHAACPHLTTSSLSSRDTSDCSPSMTCCDRTPRFRTAWHASALSTSLRSNRIHHSRRSRTPSWRRSSKPRPAHANGSTTGVGLSPQHLYSHKNLVDTEHSQSNNEQEEDDLIKEVFSFRYKMSVDEDLRCQNLLLLFIVAT